MAIEYENDSAFPIPDVGKDFAGGLTKREYFAVEILKGFLSGGKIRSIDDCVMESIETADLLISELKNT